MSLGTTPNVSRNNVAQNANHSIGVSIGKTDNAVNVSTQNGIVWDTSYILSGEINRSVPNSNALQPATIDTFPTASNLYTAIAAVFDPVYNNYITCICRNVNTTNGSLTILTNTGVTFNGSSSISMIHIFPSQSVIMYIKLVKTFTTATAFTITCNVDFIGANAQIPRVWILEEQEGSGVAGGTFTSGSWQVRVLNTVSGDTGFQCQLLGNTFQLSPGTWKIVASAPAYKVDRHQCRLFNVTTSSVQFDGSSEYMSTVSGLCMTRSLLDCIVSLSALTVFRIEHQCATTEASDGMGVGNSFGDVNIFTRVVCHLLG